MQAWKRIEPTRVTKVGWRTVISKTFIHPLGDDFVADTLDPEDQQCIATIALTPQNQVIIARQFRVGPERVMDELPGGGLERDEDPEVAARRELLEETGYEAGAMEYLGVVYKHAWMNTRWHYFLATECTQHVGGQQLDDTEDVEVKLISIDQLLRNGREGAMTDIEPLFLAYEKLMELKHAAKSH